MFKNKLNLRRMVAIAICLAGMTVYSGCDKNKDPDNVSNGMPTLNYEELSLIVGSWYNENYGNMVNSPLNNIIEIKYDFDKKDYRGQIINRDRTGSIYIPILISNEDIPNNLSSKNYMKIYIGDSRVLLTKFFYSKDENYIILIADENTYKYSNFDVKDDKSMYGYLVNCKYMKNQ